MKTKWSWVEESVNGYGLCCIIPGETREKEVFLFCFLTARFMLIVEEGWGDAVE